MSSNHVVTYQSSMITENLNLNLNFDPCYHVLWLNKYDNIKVWLNREDQIETCTIISIKLKLNIN